MKTLMHAQTYVPKASERALPVNNFRQLKSAPAYKVNPDGTVTFDRNEPYDDK